jgi:hypothetical protein
MSTTMPATKPANKPMRAKHEIKLTREGGYDSRMPHMEVGETVRYSSNPPGSGEVTVEFPERSPFREDNVTGTEVPGEVILTLVNDSGEGTLPCHYYIKPPSGPRQRIIWGGEGNKVTRPN